MVRVLTIGTGTRDIFLKSGLFKVLRDPKHLERIGFPTGEAQCFAMGGKVEIDDLVATVGGDAANAAVTFARQGFKTETLMKIGGDQNGRDVYSHLLVEKIKPIFRPSNGLKNDVSVILLSRSGERTVLVFRAISKTWDKKDVPLDKLNQQVVYVAPGRIPFSVLEMTLVKLKKNGAFIAMNPSKHYLDFGAEKLKNVFKYLDLIIANREEGSYLTGAKYEDETEIFKKFDDLFGGLVIMTDGPKGVLVSNGEKIYRAGIFKEKKIVDRTGAGDAFGSGFVAGLHHVSKSIREFTDADIMRAIRLGSANATSVVEAVGAQPGILTRRQFENESRWKNLSMTVKRIK
ncbi:MAG: carbohydrate kinase family protein [Candidatus Paceibacterota bacterium]|jgi:ribokinase